MLYKTLFVATAAFSGLVAGQNSTASGSAPSQTGLPPSIQPCCSISADNVPENLKNAWCQAEQNTCPQICGGQGQIASGGNDCDTDSLDFTCKCRNGTEPRMADYIQSVPGQMCRFWYDACVNATRNSGSQALAQQFQCEQSRDALCGNLTTSEDQSTSTRSSNPTSTGSGSESGGSTRPTSATSSGGAASSSTGQPGAAAHLVRDFGTPVFAGLLAIFGLAL